MKWLRMMWKRSTENVDISAPCCILGSHCFGFLAWSLTVLIHSIINKTITGKCVTFVFTALKAALIAPRTHQSYLTSMECNTKNSEKYVLCKSSRSPDTVDAIKACTTNHHNKLQNKLLKAAMRTLTIWTHSWRHANSVASWPHANTTLQREADQRLAGCAAGELLSVMRGHAAPRTHHQHMQIQAGSRHLLSASEVLIIDPFLQTRALKKNSHAFSSQPSGQRTGYEGFWAPRLCAAMRNIKRVLFSGWAAGNFTSGCLVWDWGQARFHFLTYTAESESTP